MLGKYLKINGETLPNPVSFEENFSKVSNEFQSEAGDDLFIDVREGKYSATMSFQVSSRWKNWFINYAGWRELTLTVDGIEHIVRITGIDCSLVPDSEKHDGTKGYWNVSFTATEI